MRGFGEAAPDFRVQLVRVQRFNGRAGKNEVPGIETSGASG